MSLLSNKAICAGRSAWYLTEMLRLRYRRSKQKAGTLVSVILPTHNREELLLSRSLPSVLAQTHKNLEIIVAAHGCSDGTFWRVYDMPDARVRVIDVPRRQTYPPTAENHWFAGPVEPLNAALALVTGDWIARLDDDDIWTMDHVETLLEFAQAGNYEFVSSAHETHEGPVGPYQIGRASVGGCQTWLYRSYLRFMKYNPDCWRKDWNRVNDVDLQHRMWRAGVRMGYLDKVTAYVYPRPDEVDVGLRAYRRDTAATERKFAF